MSQRSTALARNDTPPVGQTPAQMVAAMPSDQRAIVKKMEMTVHRVTAHVLQAYSELGRLVLRLQDSRRKRHDYGDQTIIKLADYLNVNPRTLYDCQRVAQAIPKEMLKDLLKPGVVWGHVLLLSQFCGVLPEQQDLEVWADRISSERLTVTQLRKLLLQDRLVASSESEADAANGKPKRQKSLQAALTQLDSMATAFHVKAETNFFGDAYDIVDVAGMTPPDRFDDETRQQIADVTDHLAAVANSAAKNACKMRTILAHVDRCICAAKRKGQDAIDEVTKDIDA